MTNIISFLCTHWAVILTVIAGIHTAAEVAAPIINKPGFNTTLAKIFTYLAPVLGVATKVVEAQSATVAPAVSSLTGDAAKLASGTALS